jgi:hypothetical protein
MNDFYEVGPPEDATTIASIWPKLNPDQRQWINDQSPDERRTLEGLLQTEGAAYFLENFVALCNQLDYVRTL